MALCLAASFTATDAEGSILNEIAAAIDAQVTDRALSATVVRTFYPAIHIESRRSAPENPEPTRTIINEVVATATSIREEIFEARESGVFVKRQSVSYSEDGGLAKWYDPKNKRGMVGAAPSPKSNRIARILDPYLIARAERSLGQDAPSLLERMEGAEVTSETNAQGAEGPTTILDGHYVNGDPVHRFRMIVLPTKGYAISHLEEFDAADRPLRQYIAEDFVSLNAGSQTIWLARLQSASMFTYNDQDGDFVQSSRIEILKPTITGLDDDTFALVFPNNAVVYDVQTGEFSNTVKDIADTNALQAIIDNPAFPILTGSKGKQIVSRTKLAYASSASHGPQSRGGGLLRLPRSSAETVILAAAVGILVTVFVITILKAAGRAKQGNFDNKLPK